MRRLWVVLVLLAACGVDEATPGTSSTSTAVETTATLPAVTVEDVREAAYGTAACGDPACLIVKSVGLEGERLQVTTGLFPDEDAEAPGLAVCVAATQVYDGRVQVLGSDGSTLASGQRGSVPICS